LDNNTLGVSSSFHDRRCCLEDAAHIASVLVSDLSPRSTQDNDRVDDRDRPRPAGRVKRWSSGEMALRWAAAGMLAAQSQFRRVKGYQELPQLALALERATAEEPGMLDLPAAVGT
jgi:hypothetical protein